MKEWNKSSLLKTRLFSSCVDKANWYLALAILMEYNQVVRELDFGPGSSPDRGHYVVFSGIKNKKELILAVRLSTQGIDN